MRVLLVDDEWRNNSDKWIADKCSVDNHTVAKHRSDLGIPKSPVRTGKDGRTINTENIGRAHVALMVIRCGDR